jgi:hypothetical protein
MQAPPTNPARIASWHTPDYLWDVDFRLVVLDQALKCGAEQVKRILAVVLKQLKRLISDYV